MERSRAVYQRSVERELKIALPFVSIKNLCFAYATKAPHSVLSPPNAILSLLSRDSSSSRDSLLLRSQNSLEVAVLKSLESVHAKVHAKPAYVCDERFM